MQIFIELLNFSVRLAIMTNASKFIKYRSLNNQPCINRPNLMNLNLAEYQDYIPSRTVS